MMNEDLVRRIIERLLAEPEFQQFFQTQPGLAVKPSCLILLNYVRDLPDLLEEIEDRWGAKYAISILPSGSISPEQLNFPGRVWVAPEEAFASEWQRIILPSCSANTLAKIALGIRDNAITEMAGRSVNQGISIELYTEYLGLSERTPPSYRRLYEGYLDKVAEYGVQVFHTVREQREQMLHNGQTLPGNALLENLTYPRNVAPPDDKNCLRNCLVARNNNTHSEFGIRTSDFDFQRGGPVHRLTGDVQRPAQTGQGAEPAWKIFCFAKKLLVEKDAFTFPIGSLVKIAKNTVVSPLARDTLKSRQIKLSRDTEGEK